MWTDLLKWSPLDEKNRHPAMEGLVGLFGVSLGGGFKNHTQYAKIYSMMVVRV